MFESPCAVEAQLSFLSPKRNCVCDPDDWAPILAPLIYTVFTLLSEREASY